MMTYEAQDVRRLARSIQRRERTHDLGFVYNKKTGTGFFYFIYLNIIFVFHSSANRIVIDLSQSFLF